MSHLDIIEGASPLTANFVMPIPISRKQEKPDILSDIRLH